MTVTNPSLTTRPAWKALAAHHTSVRDVHLRTLFAEDPSRGERLTAEAAGVFLDYSKNRVTGDTLRLLLQLAGECGLRPRIDAMFGGDRINITEDRAVLHVALRAPPTASIVVKVFDETMNSVSAGSRSRVASAKSVPSMLDTNRKVIARSL